MGAFGNLRTLLPGLALFLIGGRAFAHAGLPGVGDFWNGAFHPVLAFEQGAVLFALGLALGRMQVAGSRAPLAFHHSGLTAGLVLGGLLYPPDTGSLRALPLALAGFLLLDPRGGFGSDPAATAAARISRPMACTLISFGAGLAFGADIPAEVDAFIFRGGMFLAAVLFSAWGVAFWERVHPPWMLIAGRVVGSWLAAVALLLTALPPG